MELLNLKKCVVDGVSSLSKAEQWLTVSSANKINNIVRNPENVLE
jgi:hypothetical protein